MKAPAEDNPAQASSPTRRLAELIELEESSTGDWLPEELAEVFQHQWSAALPLDPEPNPGTAPPNSASPTHAGPPPLQTYGDLFAHPNPPIHLLERVKEFGKTQHAQADSSLPREIALALYYTSIFAALTRCGQRITTLSDSALRQGALWLLAQPWIDELTKSLARLGLARLDSIPPALQTTPAA
ncbi:MAG: hypothetical protein FJ387_13490 [Verrucomicrobia bacterium]|nr:hypothetical protein [Verrucomicrobiota bacterium]